MKTFLVAITIWLSSSVALASIQDELMALRLENLKTVMNARDYDLALYRLRQIDVLERACQRETAKGRIPFSCFELRAAQASVNVTAKRRIFELSSLDNLNEQCMAAINAANEEFAFGNRDVRRESKLTPGCRSLYLKKVAIETYKKTGRRIE